ncbi:MAG TPA: hypothetical protein VLR71_13215 [Casimicrobiaceae bacterium]|nr:hypothetical protein [Casimicrobiaceae bacterium]
MRSILDPAFQYTPSVATDIRKTFDRVWRERGQRRDAECGAGADRISVWLECNGALIDVAAVRHVRMRKVTRRIELLVFICPRCNGQHESLRFR